MPVHIRAGVGDLRLTLQNGEEVLDSQVAATGAEAARVAIMMIASRDELTHGDTLTVRIAAEGQSATILQGPGGGR
jgi:hypothetical protein